MIKYVKLETVWKMDLLIRKATTGTHEAFAKYLGISRTKLFEYVAYLREVMWAPIVYNELKKTFEYTYVPQFFIGSNESWKPFNDSDIENGERSKNAREEYSEDDDADLIDDDLDATELDEIYGGKDDEDWNRNSFDDNSDDISLDEDIDFNDLFPNE